LRLIIADTVSVVSAIKKVPVCEGPKEARITNPEALHQETNQQAPGLSYFRLHSGKYEYLNCYFELKKKSINRDFFREIHTTDTFILLLFLV